MSVYHVPDAAETDILEAITAENWTLRLFKTDVLGALTAAQIAALTEADFTEADFTGYSAAALTGGTWTVTGGAPTAAAYAQQTFTSSADQTAQTVYGYYFTATTGGALRGFRQLDSPISIENNGDEINVTPNLTLAFSGVNT